jgi:hypothetical protein
VSHVDELERAWVRARSCSLFSLAAKTRSTARWTFSKHVSHGSSEWFWNTTARSGPGAAISRSSQRRTPLVGRVKPGDEVEQRRLAAARVADQRHELAALDLQVDLAQGVEAALAGSRRPSRRSALR